MMFTRCPRLVSAVALSAASFLFSASAHAAEFDGTYATDGLTVVLHQSNEQITGTIKKAGNEFPLTAQANGDAIDGSFTAGGRSFPFSGDLNHGQLNFNTASAHYALHSDAGSDNPLAQPVATTTVNITNAPAAEAAPALRPQQGQYFRWQAPAGWQCNESTNGVDMGSPDGMAGVSSFLLVNMPGNPSPRQFVEASLGRVGFQNVEITAESPVRGPNPAAHTEVFEVNYNTNTGHACHGSVACAIISNGWGSFTAVYQGAGSVVEQWDQYKSWLPQVARAVTITSTRQFAPHRAQGGGAPSYAGSTAQNVPNNSSDITSGYEAYQHTQDQISQGRSETTREEMQMKDPATGEHFDVPMNNYDSTRGGYVNPNDPTTLLEHRDADE